MDLISSNPILLFLISFLIASLLTFLIIFIFMFFPFLIFKIIYDFKHEYFNDNEVFDEKES